MSTITDYTQQVETTLTRIKADLTVVQAGLATQATAIQDLQTRLAANGALTADDKAAMDQLVTDSATLADAADRIAGANAPTPPAP